MCDRDVDHQLAAGGWAIALSTHTLVDNSPAAWSDGIVSIHTDPQAAGRFGVSFAQLADFDIDLPNRAIRVRETTDLSPQTFRHFLLDQIVPRILAHEGRLILHAAGVKVGRGAALFVGRSGSGKSTLAASLHRGGHTLLGDDAMIVTANSSDVTAQAVYRSLRLFPDSVTEVLGGSASLAPVADYTAKYNVLDLEGAHHSAEMPVRALFLLEPGAEKFTALPVEPAAACMALVEQSFSLDPTDSRRATERLAQASDVVRRVPVFRLRYPRDFARLPAVHEVVVNALG